MNSINLDSQQEVVRQFVLSLPLDPEGASLEMNGQTVALIYPPQSLSIDRDAVTAAILARRDESRRLNEEWAAADSEVWACRGEDDAVQ